MDLKNSKRAKNDASVGTLTKIGSPGGKKSTNNRHSPQRTSLLNLQGTSLDKLDTISQEAEKDDLETEQAEELIQKMLGMDVRFPLKIPLNLLSKYFQNSILTSFRSKI
jgi:hypothetical protein